MSFAQNLNRICRMNGTTLTAVLKGLGFSSSKTTAINRGQAPNNEADLLKIAHALDCSVIDFFIDEGELDGLGGRSNPQDDDEEDILRVFRSLSRRERHEFMSMVYDFEKRHELEGDKASDTEEQDNTNLSAV